MSETEPSEAIVKVDRNKRVKKHLIQALGSANAFIMIFIFLIVGLFAAIRFGAMTDFGRAQIISSFNGMRVGPVGHLRVEGLKGDFFTKFELRYASISDENGVWIEGRNFKVDWESLDLARTFININKVSAEGVRIYRRPTLDNKGKYSKNYPLSLHIGQAVTHLETFEGFSAIRGDWGAAGTIDLHHNKDVNIKAQIVSPKRIGDGARIDMEIKDGVPLYSFVNAREAGGGAIAGALGLAPDRPLMINSRISTHRDTGSIDTLGLSGAEKFAQIKGNWSKGGGAINGTIGLGASLLTRGFAQKLGQSVMVNANWSRVNSLRPFENKIYQTATDITSNIAILKIDGLFDFNERQSAAPLNFDLKLASLDEFTQSENFGGGSSQLFGKLSIGRNGAILDGNFNVNSPKITTVSFSTIKGPISIGQQKGQIDMKFGFLGAGGVANSTIARAFGANPRGNIALSRLYDGRFLFEKIEIFGHAIEVHGAGSKNLLGQTELKGNAIVELAPLIGNNYRGAIETKFTARQNSGNTQTSINFDMLGRNIETQNAALTEIFTGTPKFLAQVAINGENVNFSSLKLNLKDLEVSGKSLNIGRNSALGGTISLGAGAVDLIGLKGGAAGVWGLTLGTNSRLSLNLDGKAIAAKSRQLSTILGPTPKLKGVLGLVNGGINIDEAILNVPKGQLNLKGPITSPSGYGLNLNWNLVGPNNLGPLEISGDLNGIGSISGLLSAPILRLNTKIPELGLGQTRITNALLDTQMTLLQKPIQSDLRLTGNTEFGDLVGTGTIIGVSNGLEVRAINLHGAGITANGNAKILENSDPSVDIAFNIGRGAFLESGTLTGRVQLVQNGNITMANVESRGSQFAWRGSKTLFSNFQISGRGPLSALELDTAFATVGAMPVRFAGKSLISGRNNVYDLTLTGAGALDGRNFSISDPVRLMFEKSGQSAKGVINFASGANINQGFVDFNLTQKPTSMRAQIKAQNLSLAILQQDFLGTFSGEVELNGQGSELRGIMFGELKDARARGLGANLALNGNVNARLNGNELALDVRAANSQGLALEANSTLPMITSAAPLRLAIERTKQISGAYKIVGEVRSLADLVFAGERVLAGHVDSHGEIGGSLNAPKLIGDFKLERGTFREAAIGLNLVNLNLNGSIDRDKIFIRQFSANDNQRGVINGAGEIRTGQIASSSFNINTRRFRIVETDTAKVDATAELVLTSNIGQRSKLSGNMRIDFAEFSPRGLSGSRVVSLDVEEINLPASRNISPIAPTSGSPQQAPRRRSQSDIDIDVAINAARGVFVRGSGLNLELSVDAHTKGTLSAPALSGSAKVYRGEYEYGGRSFLFEENGTINLSSNPNNIRLNLLARRDTANLIAKIAVTGTAADPKIRLTSTPELPQDEILAQVLFGRSRAQLSPLETVQLAASLASLASGGGFDVMSSLREISRLDRLVFANTATGEVSVAGGKYLGRDLYLELISEGTQGVSTRVEWRPSRSTAIVSRLGADGDAKVSIRWRRDIK